MQRMCRPASRDRLGRTLIGGRVGERITTASLLRFQGERLRCNHDPTKKKPGAASQCPWAWARATDRSALVTDKAMAIASSDAALPSTVVGGAADGHSSNDGREDALHLVSVSVSVSALVQPMVRHTIAVQFPSLALSRHRPSHESNTARTSASLVARAATETRPPHL